MCLGGDNTPDRGFSLGGLMIEVGFGQAERSGHAGVDAGSIATGFEINTKAG